MHFTGTQIFALDSAVVEVKEIFSPHGDFITSRPGVGSAIKHIQGGSKVTKRQTLLKQCTQPMNIFRQP